MTLIKKNRKKHLSVNMPEDVWEYIDKLRDADPAERGRGLIIADIIRKDMKKQEKAKVTA